MEKLKSKNLKLLYQDGIMRFYCLAEPGRENLKPIVFINGQMGHQIQAIETATDATKSSCYQYHYYYEYDETIHTPYIFLYDYPIHRIDKSAFTTALFANSLINALKACNLSNVDIMGESVGAIIGMRASVDPRVDEVIALHPPILGSPLADVELLRSNIHKLNLKQKIIYLAIKAIVDISWGFQKENCLGCPSLNKESEPTKSKVVGSSIYGLKNKGLEKELVDMIYKVSKKESDAVITWDKNKLEDLGFHIVEDEKPTSHFGMNRKYTVDNYTRLLVKNINR